MIAISVDRLASGSRARQPLIWYLLLTFSYALAVLAASPEVTALGIAVAYALEATLLLLLIYTSRVGWILSSIFNLVGVVGLILESRDLQGIDVVILVILLARLVILAQAPLRIEAGEMPRRPIQFGCGIAGFVVLVIAVILLSLAASFMNITNR